MENVINRQQKQKAQIRKLARQMSYNPKLWWDIIYVLYEKAFSGNNVIDIQDNLSAMLATLMEYSIIFLVPKKVYSGIQG